MACFTDISMYAHLASAFINDDQTDMSDDEFKEFQQLRADLYTYMKCSSYTLISVSEDTWFSKPEIGGNLWGDIATFHFMYTPL